MVYLNAVCRDHVTKVGHFCLVELAFVYVKLQAGFFYSF